ncbi:MAG: FAD-binding protein, partial [Clostridiales bacterium]|nr:FAD-binding protein [Clostridiales bacterium]
MSYTVDQANCSGCHRCRVECPSKAIRFKNSKYWIEAEKCTGCGHCVEVCHNDAISDPDKTNTVTARHELVKKTCDVLVIGGGASGMAAGAKAASMGKKVIVLEKGREVGGSAWYAHVFRSLWSDWHKEAGCEDPRDKIYRQFMKKTKNGVNGKLVRRILDADADFVNWLIREHDLGRDFKFGDNPFGGKGLIGTYEWDYNVNRIDTTIGPGGTGWFLCLKLLGIIEANGGEVLYRTAATKLLTDENGRITGARARDEGGETEISCKSCVVAAGAFSRNKELTTRFQKKFYQDEGNEPVHVFTCSHCTGDGITMCEELEADIDFNNFRAGMFGPMRHPFGTCSIAAANCMSSIKVDKSGN